MSTQGGVRRSVVVFRGRDDAGTAVGHPRTVGRHQTGRGAAGHPRAATTTRTQDGHPRGPHRHRRPQRRLATRPPRQGIALTPGGSAVETSRYPEAVASSEGPSSVLPRCSGPGAAVAGQAWLPQAGFCRRRQGPRCRRPGVTAVPQCATRWCPVRCGPGADRSAAGGRPEQVAFRRVWCRPGGCLRVVPGQQQHADHRDRRAARQAHAGPAAGVRGLVQ